MLRSRKTHRWVLLISCKTISKSLVRDSFGTPGMRLCIRTVSCGFFWKLGYNTFFFRVDLLTALSWVVAWLLDQTSSRVDNLRKQGQSPFEIRNNSQAFHANNLAIVYAHVSHRKKTHFPQFFEFFFGSTA
jgi:hypothetical protein